jgi:hypothetical protein
MNHIVVSDKNYRLYAGTLEACKEFAKDWAIKNKRSPKIVSERSFVQTKARQAGESAEQLVMTAVVEHLRSCAETDADFYACLRAAQDYGMEVRGCIPHHLWMGFLNSPERRITGSLR